MERIEDLRRHFWALLDGTVSPQRAGELICAESLGRGSGQWPCLWLLWATLTSACATGEHTADEGEELMRHAAREWLDLAGEETEWRRYFERWLGDLVGSYEPAVSGPLDGCPEGLPVETGGSRGSTLTTTSDAQTDVRTTGRRTG